MHTSIRTLLRRGQDQLADKSTLSLTKKSVPELNDQPSYLWSHMNSIHVYITQTQQVTNFRVQYTQKAVVKTGKSVFINIQIPIGIAPTFTLVTKSSCPFFSLSRISSATAFWVHLSSLSNFLATSRFRSQSGFRGARLVISCNKKAQTSRSVRLLVTKTRTVGKN